MLAAGAVLRAWLRVATAVAGLLGLISPLFFPFMVLLVRGLVFGIWSLATKRTEEVTAPVVV